MPKNRGDEFEDLPGIKRAKRRQRRRDRAERMVVQGASVKTLEVITAQKAGVLPAGQSRKSRQKRRRRQKRK